jgi:hypothetical protein
MAPVDQVAVGVRCTAHHAGPGCVVCPAEAFSSAVASGQGQAFSQALASADASAAREVRCQPGVVPHVPYVGCQPTGSVNRCYW